MCAPRRHSDSSSFHHLRFIVVFDIEVVNIDVEPLDVYFAGGVLVHNKGTDSDPA